MHLTAQYVIGPAKNNASSTTISPLCSTSPSGGNKFHLLTRKMQNAQTIILPPSLMFLSHLGEYACEWAYECNSVPIRNDRKRFVGVRKHSWRVRKHSRGLAKIRNMLLKFVRKA